MKTAVVVLNPSGLSVARQICGLLPDTELHGFGPRVNDVDVRFDDVLGHLRERFAEGVAIIGVCSSGILVRAIGPMLDDKAREAPVIAVSDDGMSVVPLVGGHRGGNALARTIADGLKGHAAITTAGDVALGVALDAPPQGWVLANPAAAKTVMADILGGATVTVAPELTWLDAARFNRKADGDVKLTASVRPLSPGVRELVYHPKRVIIGVGSDRGCPPEELAGLVADAMTQAGVAREAVACVVSIDRKADEAAVHEVARGLGVGARFLTADAINAVADRIPNPSAVVLREVGVPGVSEGAALVASGADRLLLEKRKSQRATCAIALADRIIDPALIGRARGSVAVVGVGPGTPAWRSAESVALLRQASDWVGYGLYLDLVSDVRRDQTEHRFALGDEEVRVRHALELAAQGLDVALVCSGDAGIYAMAALVCEVIALDPASSGLSDGAHRVALQVAPGISAVQAAAARAGAPIGHDFCCISLSDLLTPWSVIERRIRAAADADFVVGFYNPRSMRRRDHLDRALEILRRNRPGDTPVIIASNLGRPTEALKVETIETIQTSEVDMLSIVIVGASTTQTMIAGDGRQLVFTPRGYAAKREAAQ